MFVRDDPRGPVQSLRLRCWAALDALPIAPALAVPFLFAAGGGAVGLLVLPLPPSPRRLPAALAAIALPRIPRREAPLAPFQQTPPRAGPSFFSARRLFFATPCRTLGKAHGR